MTTSARILLLGAGAVLALGVLPACSSESSQHASAATSAVSSAVMAAMPSSATYIADVPEKDGSTMTMAITVKGESVVAYATNGTNDEAYFFGTQNGGRMDLMSMYGDEVQARFDGVKVNGEVTMNETAAAPVSFAASMATAPAGLYTATHGTARATWVVRANSTNVGVMDNSAPGDHKVTDAAAAHQQAFKDGVRQMRVNRQLQQAPPMNITTHQMDMNGSTVTAVPVTGDMSL